MNLLAIWIPSAASLPPRVTRLLFLCSKVPCLDAHNTSRKIRDDYPCRSVLTRVPRLRTTSSSLLQLERTPGHLSSLSRPIPCFLFGRSFSLANEWCVFLIATRRGTDRDGVAEIPVVCCRSCRPVRATAHHKESSVAERSSPFGAMRRKALARPPRTRALRTLAPVSSLLLPRGREGTPVGILPPGRPSRPRVFLELHASGRIKRKCI
jgi:hypothetical protein